MLNIDAHNDQVCTEIESAILSSAQELKQSALTTRPRRHFSNRNNREYIDRRCNSVTTVQKVMNELKKLENRLYIYGMIVYQIQWFGRIWLDVILLFNLGLSESTKFLPLWWSEMSQNLYLWAKVLNGRIFRNFKYFFKIRRCTSKTYAIIRINIGWTASMRNGPFWIVKRNAW